MMNLGDLLRVSAERNPQKTAIVFGEEHVSYEELDRSSASLARWLLRHGCRPGDRVLLHWPNSIELVKLLSACFKAGLIAVPVNIKLKAPEVAYILAHSKPAICFVYPDLICTMREVYRAARLSLQCGTDDLEDHEQEIALPRVDTNDSALILYASGTTTRPKGVTHTHRTILRGLNLLGTVVPNDPQTVLVMTQMAHISGIYFVLLATAVRGETCVLIREFDAASVLDAIERFHCSCTFGLPTMVQFLSEEQTRRPRHVRSLRAFVAAGDCVPVSIQERFQGLFGIPVREGYGMTETGPAICNPADAIRPGSLGKALDGVEVRIVNAIGAVVPQGQTGEIAVRSSGNFAGYWDDIAATNEVMWDGWFYTGDLAHQDADGYVWFEGRKKEIIVRDGLSISPQEVEEVIYGHEAVLETAVIGMPDPLPVRGQRVVAFVRLRDGMVASGSELRAYASQRLADFKVPDKIVFSQSLPKGITGKILRRAIKEPVSAAADEPAMTLNEEREFAEIVPVRGLPGLGVALQLHKNALAFLSETVSRYGDRVELNVLGRRVLLLANPADVNDVLVAKATDFGRSTEVKALRAVFGDGIYSSEGERWRAQRRLVQPAFHHKRIAQYSSAIVKRMSDRVSQWHSHEPLDVSAEMSTFCTDVICEVTFGRGQNSYAKDIANSVSVVFESLRAEILYLPLWRKLPFTRSRRWNRAIKILNDGIDHAIAERRSGSADNESLLGLLLAAENENGQKIPDEYIHDEVITMFVAGQETSAVALSWALASLAQHSDFQEEAAAEVAQVTGGREVIAEDFSQFKLLDAIVRETLRLYPPLWAIGRTAVRDTILGNITVSPGTEIWMPIYRIHRDVRWFSEPDVFNPHRWNSSVRQPKFGFFPFGGGSRNCLAQHFAMAELVLGLAVVLSRFRFRLTPGTKMQMDAWLTLRPKNGVPVTVSAR